MTATPSAEAAPQIKVPRQIPSAAKQAGDEKEGRELRRRWQVGHETKVYLRARLVRCSRVRKRLEPVGDDVDFQRRSRMCPLDHEKTLAVARDVIGPARCVDEFRVENEMRRIPSRF